MLHSKCLPDKETTYCIALILIAHYRMVFEETGSCPLHDLSSLVFWPSLHHILVYYEPMVCATGRAHAGFNLWHILCHNGHLCE